MTVVSVIVLNLNCENAQCFWVLIFLFFDSECVICHFPLVRVHRSQRH